MGLFADFAANLLLAGCLRLYIIRLFRRLDIIVLFFFKSYISRVVARWAVLAGINKHITFHCARHTFATLCLTYDIDLYTVSKLLGHRDIKTTQIYAKLIDKKKDEAIDKLPKI